jgi:hypothetical protein
MGKDKAELLQGTSICWSTVGRALGLNREDPAAGQRRDWPIPIQASEAIM